LPSNKIDEQFASTFIKNLTEDPRPIEVLAEQTEKLILTNLGVKKLADAIVNSRRFSTFQQ